MINRNNFRELIEKYVKRNHLFFTVFFSDDLDYTYKISGTFLDTFINIEHGKGSKDDDSIVMSMYLRFPEKHKNIILQVWDSSESYNDYQSELNDFFNNRMKIHHRISSIKESLDQMKSVCEEYNMNYIDIINNFLYEN